MSGFDFLPSIDDHCSPVNFTNFSTKCLLGFADDDDFLVRIKDKLYFKKDMLNLIRDESYYRNTFELRKRYDLPDVFKLDNPGVSVMSFFLRSNPTPIKLEWDKRLRRY